MRFNPRAPEADRAALLATLEAEMLPLIFTLLTVLYPDEVRAIMEVPNEITPDAIAAAASRLPHPQPVRLRSFGRAPDGDLAKQLRAAGHDYHEPEPVDERFGPSGPDAPISEDNTFARRWRLPALILVAFGLSGCEEEPPTMDECISKVSVMVYRERSEYREWTLEQVEEVCRKTFAKYQGRP